jgi:type I restriction enzyme S subunit
MNWPCPTIGELCERTTHRDPSLLPEQRFTYIDISSVDKESKRIMRPTQLLGSDAPSRARKEIQTGDILVSTVRPNLNAVAFVPGELAGEIASTGFCVLRPKPSVVLSKYLFYWTLTRTFVAFLVSRARGASYPAVSDAVVLSCRIPLAPVSEQRRIVDVLDCADALREQRSKADAVAEQTVGALFVRMFGDLGSNPMKWPVVPIRNVANIIVPTRDKPKQFDGEVPWVTLPDVRGMFISTARNLLSHEDAAEVGNRLMPAKTVLLSCAGSLGRVAVTDREVYANQQFYGLVTKPTEMDPLFLAWSLRLKGQRFFEALAGVSTLAFFSKDRALDITVAKPPLEHQQLFAERVRSFKEIEHCQTSSLEGITRLFAVLLERSFRGELTARWREAHRSNLLLEMQEQARVLGCSQTGNLTTA